MVSEQDIQQPMDETKGYFDATAAILAMGEKVKVLESFIVLQLQINEKMMGMLKGVPEEEQSKLHMPKLIGIGKPN